MLKKSLIFVSAALFLVALITLTGCPTSVNDDSSSGVKYTHRIYGRNVDPYQAQEAIDNAVAAGEAIYLEDRLTIGNGFGHLNFKGAQVIIGGAVSFPGGVVSVADATVSWAEGANFTLTNGSYIHRKGANISGVTNLDALVEFADSPAQIMDTARKAAVRNVKLGPKRNYDYSTDSNGVDILSPAINLQELFVLDALSIDNLATAPGAGLTVTAMGIVDIVGTPPDGVLNPTAPLPLTIRPGTCSTITTSKGGVHVNVLDNLVIPNIKVDEGKGLIIQTTGVFVIAGKLSGTGTLEVLGAISDITIARGDGSVRFSGNANPGVIEIGSTGTITFDPNILPLTLTGSTSTIEGDVVFNRDVTADAALTLNGNVTLGNATPTGGTTTVRTLTINSGNYLILGKNKSIFAAFTPKGGALITAPVLSAGSDDVILQSSPVAGIGNDTVLTTAANPTQNSDAKIAEAKVLTLVDNPLWIIDGTLQVASDAALILADNLETNIQGPTQFGYLALADKGSLTISSTGSHYFELGDTRITGTSKLTASGGTITLGNNTITGSVPGAVLASASGTPVFTLTSTPPEVKFLTLQQVNLDLTKNGRITFATSLGGRVILTKTAKITFIPDEGGKATTRSKIGTNFIVLSGGFVGLTSPSATTTEPVWSIAHRDAAAADVSIVAGDDGSISKSGTSFTL